MMKRLIPKVFFDTLEEGLDLFVGGMAFTVLHRDETLAVVGREGAMAYVVASPEYAAKDRPEIAIETDTIDALHAEIVGRRADLVHPNLPVVTRREWGAREFALLDATGVCVVFRDWGRDG